MASSSEVGGVIVERGRDHRRSPPWWAHRTSLRRLCQGWRGASSLRGPTKSMGSASAAVRDAVQRRVEPAGALRAALAPPRAGGGRAGAAVSDRHPATRADAPGVIDLIGRVFVEYGWIWDSANEVPDLIRWTPHYEPPEGAFFVVREGAHRRVGRRRSCRTTAPPSCTGSISIPRARAAAWATRWSRRSSGGAGTAGSRDSCCGRTRASRTRTGSIYVTASARPASGCCRRTSTRRGSTISSESSET